MTYAIWNRGCGARVEELRAEFGGILTERIIESEALDFIWEGRIRERYLGLHVAQFGEDETSEDVSRIAVLSSVGGRWHVGLCLVDGEGEAVDLLWRRGYGSREEAEIALERAH
jgi:hypothetical protein